MSIRMIVLIWIIAFVGCQTDSSQNGPFLPGTIVGVNENLKLEETSGLAASTRYPGSFWAHNDSENPAQIFLLDSAARTIRTFSIAARNRDWEDIAIGTWSDSTTVLFIGDIGDNGRKHEFNYIYCVKEPDTTEVSKTEPLELVSTLCFTYADGPRDAETLLFDPITRNLFVVTKSEHEVHVYEITYPYPSDTVSIGPSLLLPVRHITAGSISRDGSEILIKSYIAVYYWKRQPGQSVIDALRAEPVELPYEQEPLGEAISWASDGSGYYTLSENGKGERGRLIFYQRSVEPDSINRKP